LEVTSVESKLTHLRARRKDNEQWISRKPAPPALCDHGRKDQEPNGQVQQYAPPALCDHGRKDQGKTGVPSRW
jgi:hypothetical protein